MKAEDPVTMIRGIGPKTAKILEKAGIITAGDLLGYYPRTYCSYPEPVSIADRSHDEQEEGAYLVTLTTSAARAGASLTVLSLRDGSAFVQAVWMHDPYIVRNLHIGSEYVFYGKILQKRGRRCIYHPTVFTPAEYQELRGSLQPVYPLTAGLSQKFLRKSMKQLLAGMDLQADSLTSEVRKKYALAEKNFALRQIHFPEDPESLRLARKRLVFDEFFDFCLQMAFLRRENEESVSHYFIDCAAGVDDFIKSLPYQLTGAQMRVWGEIAADLRDDRPMNRLVQGDVGSGKTILAALAMLDTALSGYQSALMAPTEVLARQHYEKLAPMLEPFGVRCLLLTGSMTASQKREAYKALEKGEADIAIGTQALFQKKALYENLALIVTDEQHRFGVHQREALAMKAGDTPHMLVMSATPIPRTLAIIVYGDLDISVVDEIPAGRPRIKSCVIGEQKRMAAFHFLLKEVQSGHQAYVVCPMVEDSPQVDAQNVQDYTEKLRRAMPSGLRIEYIHGKMKSMEKNDIMDRFYHGQIDILVSTTVIEVGVDCPNATVMMIENSERFGLAQLHQLRGRVGRGRAQSYCIFLCGKQSEQIQQRLSVMMTAKDGFEIARADLALRGPGEFFGTRQSGSLDFTIGDVFSDSEILVQASRAVHELLQQDPGLGLPEHALLREKLTRKIPDGQIIL